MDNKRQGLITPCRASCGRRAPFNSSVADIIRVNRITENRDLRLEYVRKNRELLNKSSWLYH